MRLLVRCVMTIARVFENEADSIVPENANEISLNESMLWLWQPGVALVLVVSAVSTLTRKDRGVGAPWPVYAKRLRLEAPPPND